MKNEKRLVYTADMKIFMMKTCVILIYYLILTVIKGMDNQLVLVYIFWFKCTPLIILEKFNWQLGLNAVWLVSGYLRNVITKFDRCLLKDEYLNYSYHIGLFLIGLWE